MVRVLYVFLIVGGLALLPTFGQTTKSPLHTQPFEPERIIELPKLTAKITRGKLEPIWDAHSCDDPEVFWVYNYGTNREIKRRVILIVDSIGRRCGISGFRIVFFDAGIGKKPLTVLWRAYPGTTPPKP